MPEKQTTSREIRIFLLITLVFFFILALLRQSPLSILQGLCKIVISRDALITDYFLIGGEGAAFFNVAALLMMGMFLLHLLKIPLTGMTLACLFMFCGYGLFGKNPINILPILFGTYLYAKVQRSSLNRYLYVAMFATCLAPLVTEMIYLLPFSAPVNAALAVLLGIVIGFVLPPLSTHTVSMHMGYNLFNVGFAGGLLGFLLVCILRSFNLISTTSEIWQVGRPLFFIVAFYLYFSATFLYGLILCRFRFGPMLRIFRHPGRAIADFIIMDGTGPTFMNMGLVGCVILTYILLIGGDLSGPVLGAILCVFGFAAFGVHIKNYLPVLIGVFLASCVKIYDPTLPGIQLAAVFAAALSPVCGQFGLLAGIIAGILHTSVVMYSSTLYAGLNLYNNGFSAGLVAILMVPVLESFIKRFKNN